MQHIDVYSTHTHTQSNTKISRSVIGTNFRHRFHETSLLFSIPPFRGVKRDIHPAAQYRLIAYPWNYRWHKHRGALVPWTRGWTISRLTEINSQVSLGRTTWPQRSTIVFLWSLRNRVCWILCTVVPCWNVSSMPRRFWYHSFRGFKMKCESWIVNVWFVFQVRVPEPFEGRKYCIFFFFKRCRVICSCTRP